MCNQLLGSCCARPPSRQHRSPFSLVLSISSPPSRQILDVLCSLCVCNGVAVRTNQNLICDHLLPKRDLLLQTQLVNDVQRLDSSADAILPFERLSKGFFRSLKRHEISHPLADFVIDNI